VLGGDISIQYRRYQPVNLIRIFWIFSDWFVDRIAEFIVSTVLYYYSWTLFNKTTINKLLLRIYSQCANWTRNPLLLTNSTASSLIRIIALVEWIILIWRFNSCAARFMPIQSKAPSFGPPLRLFLPDLWTLSIYKCINYL
jgi:hypothetical protein